MHTNICREEKSNFHFFFMDFTYTHTKGKSDTFQTDVNTFKQHSKSMVYQAPPYRESR